MRGREKFEKFKPAINVMVKMYSMLPRSIRNREMARLRNKTGNIALVKRYALLKTLAKSVGDNVSVFPDVYLRNVQEMEIGNNVSFQPMVYIEAYGGVKIGNDVSIAEGASLFSVSHGFDDMCVPIKDQPLIPLPIEIENNIWIGAKATVLGGVKVSSGTIVAAGAVVRKDTGNDSIVAGVPARTIKIRGQKG